FCPTVDRNRFRFCSRHKHEVQSAEGVTQFGHCCGLFAWVAAKQIAVNRQMGVAEGESSCRRDLEVSSQRRNRQVYRSCLLAVTVEERGIPSLRLSSAALAQ